MTHERSSEGTHKGPSRATAARVAGPLEHAPPESLAGAARPREDHESGPQTAIREGSIIDGRYRVIRQLAEGGMGRVMVARHEVTGANVALKVLRPDVADDTSHQRFTREVRVATRVAHPHVIRILDGGRTAEGAPYYVMELLDGIDLSDLLARECTLPPPRALRILRQLAETLDYAHAHGVVHRDLKPENVMIDERRDDYVTVLDFGIARQMGNADPGLTQRGIVLGTPAYMSPEHALGMCAGPSSDHYALAAIALEMLTGSLPHEQYASPLVTIDWLVRCRARAPSELGLDVPGLDDVFARALAHDPQQRFASATAFVDALAHVFGMQAARTTSALSAPATPPSRALDQSEPLLLMRERRASLTNAPPAPAPSADSSGSSPMLAGPVPQGRRRAARVLAIAGAATSAALAAIAVAWLAWSRAPLPEQATAQASHASIAAAPPAHAASTRALVADEPSEQTAVAAPEDAPIASLSAREATPQPSDDRAGQDGDGSLDRSAARRVSAGRRAAPTRPTSIDAAVAAHQPVVALGTPVVPAAQDAPVPEAGTPRRAPPRIADFVEDPGF